jgi:hypothetical protein
MLPDILKNMNLFVDGRGFAGQINELTPPKLVLKMEEHRAGGMDAPIELEMGMEALKVEVTVASYDKELFKLFGLTQGGVVALTARGAIEQGDGTVIPLVENMRGQISEIDEGTWKPGDKGAVKLTIACRYYKRTQAGEELIEIDVENMIRKIGGVDQLAAQRSALGI